MTLFTRLASAALTGLCIVGAAGAAYAHHLPRQPWVEQETTGLLRAAQRHGVRVFTDSSPSAKGACKEGLYGAANSQNQLLICVGNHGGDRVELADTVRHELIHNAQYCKGRKGGATIALLYPDKSQQFFQAAKDQLHMPVDKYPEAQYLVEAEARVLAHVMEEDQIAELLEEHCG